jgi:hypothetical protein
MMEAGIPTRKWKHYDLATVVARDEKKGSRFQGTAEHIETGTGEVKRLKRSDSSEEGV